MDGTPGMRVDGGGSTAVASETMGDAWTRVARGARAALSKASPSWRTFIRGRFQCPMDAKDARTRAKANAREFGYNYYVAAWAPCALSARANASAGLMLIGIYCAHHYACRVRKGGVEVNGVTFSPKAVRAMATIGAAVAYAVFVLPAFVGALVFALAFALAHATMRVPDKADEGENADVPLFREFKASIAESYRDSGVSDYVPSQVSSAARSVFGASARK